LWLIINFKIMVGPRGEGMREMPMPSAEELIKKIIAEMQDKHGRKVDRKWRQSIEGGVRAALEDAEIVQANVSTLPDLLMDHVKSGKFNGEFAAAWQRTLEELGMWPKNKLVEKE
jgi:hypothetical protein